jgi:hypothetical protein
MGRCQIREAKNRGFGGAAEKASQNFEDLKPTGKQNVSVSGGVYAPAAIVDIRYREARLRLRYVA